MARGDFVSAASFLANSRAAMNELLKAGDALANEDIGIPMWDE